MSWMSCGSSETNISSADLDIPQSVENQPTLTVATEPASPPFETINDQGELEGFDIDLMNALGREGGFAVQYERLPFDDIMPALEQDRVDVAISTMTITAERAQIVSFSRPYFKAGLGIAVAKDNTSITTLEDLQGQAVAVQSGTTGAVVAADIAGIKIKTFDSVPQTLRALAKGKVDAAINDIPVMLTAIASGDVKGIKLTGKPVTEEFYGIAMPKESEHLGTINDALDDLMESGEYSELYQTWFGSYPPELPKSAF